MQSNKAQEHSTPRGLEEGSESVVLRPETEDEPGSGSFLKSGQLLQILSVLLVGAVIRFYRLGYHSLWLDEAHGRWITAKSFGEMIRYINIYEIHPYLYYLILHYVQQFFGNSEFVLRLPSVLAGIAGIYSVYLLTRETTNHKYGILAALFMSLSCFDLMFSQEVRMYSMQNFLQTLTVYHFLRGLRTGEKKYWYWHAFTAVLAVYLDYRSVLVLAGTFTFFFLHYKKYREQAEIFAKSYLVQTFLIIPLIPLALKHTGKEGMAAVHTTLTAERGLTLMLRSLFGVAGGMVLPVDSLIASLIAVPLLVFFLWGSFMRLKRRGTDSVCISYIFLISMFVLYAIMGQKLYSIRHIVSVAPFFVIGLAQAAFEIRGKVPRYIIAVALILLLAFNLVSSYHWFFVRGYGTQDFRTLASILEKSLNNDDIVVIVPKYMTFPFEYYYRMPNKAIILKPELLPEISEEILETKGRVWWVFAGDRFTDTKSSVRKWADANFVVLGSYKIRNVNYEITGPEIDIFITVRKLPNESRE